MSYTERVPRIVDYSDVVQHLTGQGLVSLYHRSGAFGFAPDANAQIVGWIGPDDSTIRVEMRPFVREVGDPYHETLARMLVQIWQSHLSGECWLLPKSHWHYELHFGNRALLEELLSHLGVDAKLLVDRNDGSAIAFSTAESEQVREAARRLTKGLHVSDFLFAFPGHPALCTVHHHEQLWWQTSKPGLGAILLRS